MSTTIETNTTDAKHNAMIGTVKRLSKYGKEGTALRIIRAATHVLAIAFERSKEGNTEAITIENINAKLRNAYVSIGRDVEHGLTLGFVRTLVNNVQTNAKARMVQNSDQFKANDPNHAMILKHAEAAKAWKSASAVVLACDAFVVAYDATK